MAFRIKAMISSLLELVFKQTHDVTSRIPDDPIAKNISWEPIASNRASFRTEKLVAVSEALEVRKTLGATLFYLLFLVLGLLALVLFLPKAIAEADIKGIVLALIISLVFCAASYYELKVDYLKFNKKNGKYYKNLKSLSENTTSKQEQGRLSEIYALQVLAKKIKNKKLRRYNNYQLNLVLNDNSRVNVIAHGSKRAIEKDAKLLSAYLAVPIWPEI